MSQSVEHDHPKSFDFLRKDIHNARDFFAKYTKTLSLRRMWDYIITEDLDIEVVKDWMDQHVEYDPAEDAVFMASYIPRTLGEVYDPERDTGLLNAGQGSELIYSEIVGLDTKKTEERDQVDDETAQEEEEVSEGEAEQDASKPRGHRHEERDAKKVSHGIIRC